MKRQEVDKRLRDLDAAWTAGRPALIQAASTKPRATRMMMVRRLEDLRVDLVYLGDLIDPRAPELR